MPQRFSDTKRRDLAIALVDLKRGCTLEDAPDPEHHRWEYDFIEAQLRAFEEGTERK